MVEKASSERSSVALQPGEGQRSTTFTVTDLPVHALAGPVHVTVYIVPHILPLFQRESLAAAIIVPSFVYP
jgi:hypothetical protein